MAHAYCAICREGKSFKTVPEKCPDCGHRFAPQQEAKVRCGKCGRMKPKSETTTRGIVTVCLEECGNGR